MKRKILYSDVPRPYDQDAARLVKIVGFFILACLLLAVLAIALINGG